ncbi:MAG: hypothetical protein Q8O16_02305 [Dehalococcoidia bacterium]|nr:hypothetical protein [Dehalococcoidia bacterium]
MATQKTYNIGDIVKFTDKDGKERVAVVYETGVSSARVETFIGVGKMRDLNTKDFQPATQADLETFIKAEIKKVNLLDVVAQLNPAAIIEREKAEHPGWEDEVKDEGDGDEDDKG